MTKFTQRIKAHRFATLAFGAALLGALAGVVLGWSGKANNYYQRQKQQTVWPKITSSISAVRILAVGPASLGNDSLLVVKLQNTSEKDIKAYTIASGKAWVTRDYFLTEESFAPGAIVDQLIPLSSNPSQDFKVPLNGTELTVTAVYFADSTSDGISPYVSRLADRHAGIRDQANRILPCLRVHSSASGQQLAAAACEAEVLQLPTKMDGKSSDYEGGLENAKQEILSQLKDIEDKGRGVNLTEAANKHEKVIRILQRLAESSQ